MSRIQSIPVDLPVDSATSSSSSLSLAWRLLRLVPFKLWLFISLAVWAWWKLDGRERILGKQVAGKRSKRKTVTSAAAAAGTPRGATPRRPLARRVPSQSSLAGSPRPSSPRGSISGSWGPAAGTGRPALPHIRSTRGSASGERQVEMQQAPSRVAYPPSTSLSARQSPQPQPPSASDYALPRSNSFSRGSPGSSFPRRFANQQVASPRSSMKRSASASGSAFGDDRDESARNYGNGVPKRSRLHLREDAEDEEDEADDEERPMELDELAQQATASARGQKRGRRAESQSSKRVRRDVSELHSGPPSPPPRTQARKHRRHDDSGEESSGNEEERLASENRRRAGRRERSGSKRTIEDVDESTPEFSDDEEERDVDRSRARNADSDVGEEEEDDEHTEGEIEGDTNRHSDKRSRSTSIRTGSEDESVMGDDVDDFNLLPAQSAPKHSAVAPTPRRRTLKSATAAGKKLVHSASAKPSPYKRGAAVSAKDKMRARSDSVQRKPGDQWVNIEGDKCRMDEDGVVRKLCEVREMRRKYKMPKDSIHPDAKVMHEVVVERWLTTNEYDELAKQRKLAWQSPHEDATDEGDGDVSMRVESEADAREGGGGRKEKPKGVYYTMGTGTPLRTHSSLGSGSRHPSSVGPASRSGSPSASTPLASNRSSASNSPTYTTLLNGRLRLPSSARAGSPASSAVGQRTWSQSRSARLAEDEKKARADRERRRKASIMLGGEEDQPEEQEEQPDEKKVKVAEPQAEPAKIKLLDFGNKDPSTTEAPAQTPTTAPATASFSFGKIVRDKSAASEQAAPATSPAPPPSSSVPNFFSGLSNPAPPKTNAKAESTPANSAASSSFSFGAPTAKVEGKPRATGAPSVPSPSEAGSASTLTPIAPVVDKPAAPPSLFSFGAPAAKEDDDASAKPAASLFGAAPSPTPASTSASSPFAFGAPTAAPATVAPAAEAVKPATSLFSFSAAPAAAVATASSTSSATSAAPSFGGFGSFGAPTSTTSATPAAAAQKPASPFSFAAPAVSPAQPVASTSTFSFGAPPVAAAAPAQSAATSPFSFGTQEASTAPPAAPATSSQFSFGAPSASSPAATSAPGVGGFSFGFGAPPPAGQVTPTGSAAPALFSFGSTNAADGSGSAAPAGARRPVRRLPNSRR